MLVDNLGVDEGQAKGGAGVLFKLAQQHLGGGDFAQVESAIPEVGELIGAAPEEGGGLLGGLSSMASSFGIDTGMLGTLAEAAGGFDKLGLDSGMIGKFLPLVLEFAQERGGDGLVEILRGVLSGGE